MTYYVAALQVRWFSFQFLMQVSYAQSPVCSTALVSAAIELLNVITCGMIFVLNALPVLCLQQLADELNDAHIALSNVLAGLPTGAKITKPDEQEQV